MNSPEEEEFALLTFFLIDDVHKVERKKKRKHRFWVKEIYNKTRSTKSLF